MTNFVNTFILYSEDVLFLQEKRLYPKLVPTIFIVITHIFGLIATLLLGRIFSNWLLQPIQLETYTQHDTINKVILSILFTCLLIAIPAMRLLHILTLRFTLLQTWANSRIIEGQLENVVSKRNTTNDILRFEDVFYYSFFVDNSTNRIESSTKYRFIFEKLSIPPKGAKVYILVLERPLILNIYGGISTRYFLL